MKMTTLFSDELDNCQIIYGVHVFKFQGTWKRESFQKVKNSIELLRLVTYYPDWSYINKYGFDEFNNEKCEKIGEPWTSYFYFPSEEKLEDFLPKIDKFIKLKNLETNISNE